MTWQDALEFQTWLTTKKGDPMVFLRLDDLSGSLETVVFNSVYSAARELLEADRIDDLLPRRWEAKVRQIASARGAGTDENCIVILFENAL